MKFITNAYESFQCKFTTCNVCVGALAHTVPMYIALLFKHIHNTFIHCFVRQRQLAFLFRLDSSLLIEA